MKTQLLKNLIKTKKKTHDDIVKAKDNKDFMIALKFRSGLLQKEAKKGWLLKASWPWQTIPEKYFQCKEPWAGHYSGSIVEVIWSMDLFTSPKASALKEAQRSFTGGDADKKALNTPERRCKAALSAAFLMVVGYHSAIEVKPTVDQYLGKPKPPIFTNAVKAAEVEKMCDINATKEMVQLMTECSSLTKANEAEAKKLLKDITALSFQVPGHITKSNAAKTKKK